MSYQLHGLCEHKQALGSYRLAGADVQTTRVCPVIVTTLVTEVGHGLGVVGGDFISAESVLETLIGRYPIIPRATRRAAHACDFAVEEAAFFIFTRLFALSIGMVADGD